MVNSNVREAKTLQKGLIISLKGIASSIEGAIASNGKPFVKGCIKDKDDSISFKMWDLSLEEFAKKVSCAGVICVQAKVDIYEDIPQLIVTQITDVPDDAAAYINASIYTGECLIHGITTHVETYVKEEWLKSLLLSTIECYSDRLAYYPYSDSSHSEYCGFANCLYRAIDAAIYHATRGLEIKPMDQNSPNIEVIIAGLLLSKLGTFNTYDVNAATGEIISTDTITKLMLGNNIHTSVANKILDNWNINGHSYADAQLEEIYKYLFKIKHCILATNRLVEPATMEAAICRTALENETDLHELYRISKTIVTGETAKLKIGQNSYNFVGN